MRTGFDRLGLGFDVREPSRFARFALRAALWTLTLVGAAACSGAGPDPSPKSYAALIAALGAPEIPARREACRAIAAIGRPAQEAVPALATLAIDPALASDAVAALVAIGPPAIPALERLLYGPDPLVRLYVSAALLELVPGHDARAVLIEAFADLSHPEVAQQAQRAVVGLGGAFVPSLARVLRDPYAPLRLRTLETLGLLGRAAGPALPLVRQCLSDADERVRAAAQELVAALE